MEQLPHLSKAFVLLPISLLVLIFLAVYPTDHTYQAPLTAAGRCTPPPEAPAVSEPDLRILLGVLTVADAYERRGLIRQAYRLQQPRLSDARVDVRFVLCNLTTPAQRVLVGMEILIHDDVIILDCAENVNDGKTYAYLSSLPRILGGGGGAPPPYDFVVKTDDDTYYLLEKLAEALRGRPRADVYAGVRVPCEEWRDGGGGFMSGMGYVLSWDLVEWVAASEAAWRKRNGPEDVMVGVWLNEAGRGRNRFDMKPRMYDFPAGPDNCFRHGLVADTVAVHKLKDNAKWAETLGYFNVTQGLKPAKYYHID